MNQDQLHLIKLLRPLNLTGSFVEVGTWKGDFASRVLQFLDCSMLYCIDPYIPFPNHVYRDSINDILLFHGDQIYDATKQRLEQIGPNRVQMIRKESLEAVNDFEDMSLDFVYIDANHEYNYALQDILAWYPKVKPGGILAGDDVWSTDLNEYSQNNNMFIQFKDSMKSKAYFGVYPALKEAEKQLGIEITILKSQFYHIKPM